MKEKTLLLVDTVHPLLLQLLMEYGFEITEAYNWDKDKIVREIVNIKA